MRLNRLWLACCLLALMPSVSTAGTVYRWVDGGGQIHFSQVPPPRGVPYTVLQGAGGASASGAVASDPGAEAAAQQQREQTRQFLERRDAENKAREEAREQAQTEKQAAVRKCQEARERARFLEERTAQRLLIPADDGNLARMPEDEFMRRLDQAKQDAEKHCR